MARILIVDDEELARRSIGTVLRRVGHLIDFAEDGEAALAKFRPDRYDLVITDIVMPRIEGIEIVRTLRRLEPGVRIIAISGGGTDQGFYLKAAAALGADATLQKPFRAAELRRTVENLLATPKSSSEILWYCQGGHGEADPKPGLTAPVAHKRHLPLGEVRFCRGDATAAGIKKIRL